MIDPDTGNIHLPNGYVITPALTLKEFRHSWFGQRARINRPCGAPEQCWFHENAGVTEGQSFSAGLSFQGQALTGASLVCETLMTGEEEEAWIERKSTHDALLRQDLGEPDTFTDTYGMEAPELGKAPNHLRPWGKAVSEFDYGGGDAYISITYHNDKVGDDKQ